MADATQTPATTANTISQNQESWTKRSFFWGNESVFENLEKFEQISNPTGADQEFDFSFEEEESVPNEGTFTPSSAETFQIESPSFTRNSQPAEIAPEEKSDLIPESPLNVEILPPAEKTASEETEEEVSFEAPLYVEPLNQEKTSTIPSEKEEKSAEHKEEQARTSEQEAHHQMESEPKSELSNLMQAYTNLFTLSKEILTLQNKIEKATNSDFEILGNNTEKSVIRYTISPQLEENGKINSLLLHKKIEDLIHNEVIEHELLFKPEEADKNLTVNINGALLYEENKDLQDPLKATQVLEKINKFNFLLEQKHTELKKKREEIEAEKEKMKAVRDIFRNF